MARFERLETVGIAVLRYGVVLLLLVIGASKFQGWEAEAIKPLVEHSPFLGWMLGVFGVQGTSNLIGVTELVVGVAIASRPITPAISAAGSIVGIGIFLTTLSFLFTTPGVLSLRHPASGFLMKDVVLLGAMIATTAEALRAAAARKTTARRTAPSGTPARAPA
jgi:reactive chlorine resistance protein C